MKTKILNIISWILAILPSIILILVYNTLPNQIIVHWDFNGNTEYGSKNTLLIFAIITLLIKFVYLIIPKIDPKKENYKKFQTIYNYYICVFMLIFNIMLCLMILHSFYPNNISVPKILIFILSLMFIIIGNYTPKIRPNFFIGLRTPWTISNTLIWEKTHRLFGKFMFVSGLISLISSIFLTEKTIFIVFFSTIMLAIIIPSIMSYLWYKKI